MIVLWEGVIEGLEWPQLEGAQSSEWAFEAQR